MAICTTCGQEKTTADGCTLAEIENEDGSLTPRKAYPINPFNRNQTRCVGCGALDGFYHHPGCPDELAEGPGPKKEYRG
jgi:hypothetical protein